MPVAVKNTVAIEIATQQELARAEIARLQAEIASTTKRGFLVSLADDFQKELAYLDNLTFLNQLLASVGMSFEDPRLALLSQMRYLATEANYLVANNNREGVPALEGRRAALKVATDAVYYALYDDLQGEAK